jgi:hypothetical protein
MAVAEIRDDEADLPDLAVRTICRISRTIG